MARYMEIALEQRDVRCVARLLDEEAPRTAKAVWNALPMGGQAYHAKYARNEVYTFVPSFADPEPGLEHPTVTPIPGDVCYFSFGAGQLHPGTYGYAGDEGSAGQPSVVDLAIFYGRNNLLINGDLGWVPGNVFATIEENLAAMAEACNDVWRNGWAEERLSFRRIESR